MLTAVRCPEGLNKNGQTLPCSGHGRCLSLREVVSYQDFVTFFNRTTYSDWDADKVHGCACDSGWGGVACNRMICPKGDDPHTLGQENTVQIIDCTCTTCKGSLQFGFENQLTMKLPYDASPELLQYRLSVS